MYGITTDVIELSKRIGSALLAVANVPIQDEERAAGSLIGVGVGALLDQGKTVDDIRMIFNLILSSHPEVSAEMRRAGMKVVP